jgi:excisionase family DNA binding protein
MSAKQDHGSSLSLGVPPELLEAIATRVADQLAEHLPEPPTPYLKIEEAAEYLACPVSRIRDLKDQGRLRHYRDGRRLLFRREDLDGALTIREPEPR